jgi:DNA-binding CsgD family transcriptional regulator
MNRLQFDHVLERLTYRRKEVLLQVLAGHSDAAIAQALTITEATVRKHIEHICKSFKITNDWPDERRCKRPELIALFEKYKPDWVKIQQDILIQDKVSQSDKNTNLELEQNETDFSTIYNRDVFILIDQSGSMVRKDADTGTQTRYEYLQEVVEGHIAEILSVGQGIGKNSTPKICEFVRVYFFSRLAVSPSEILISDASQTWKLFCENRPKTKTFVVQTLEKCLEIWQQTGQPNGRGAFIIIYTDGQFDDEDQFIQCLIRACQIIEHHQILKIFVLGLGQDINIHHFLQLDFNVNQQIPFNIFVFDLINEVDSIIDLLKRQLIDHPHLAFPQWVKQRYPEFVKKMSEI